MILYFAFGSNMLTGRLVRRCASARAIGRAWADGHELVFSKPGADRSGKATLVPGRARDPHQGVVFEINAADLDVLDRVEGAGIGYDRIDRFPIVHADSGRSDCAVTYRARAIDSSLRPYDWYLALMIMGAMEHRLPAAQIQALRNTAFIPDPDPARQSRQEALEVLRATGCLDPADVLPRGG